MVVTTFCSRLRRTSRLHRTTKLNCILIHPFFPLWGCIFSRFNREKTKREGPGSPGMAKWKREKKSIKCYKLQQILQSGWGRGGREVSGITCEGLIMVFYFLATFLRLKIEGRVPGVVPYAERWTRSRAARMLRTQNTGKQQGKALEIKIDTKNLHHLHRHALI